MPVNNSFYAIPAVWVVGMSSHWFAIYLTKASKAIPDFDNTDVRSFQAKIAAMDRKNPVVGKYVRAEAATANTYETLPLFACAVLAGAVARLPLESQHKFAFSYVALRAVYSLLYVNVTNQKLSGLRSVVWLTGVVSIFNQFIQAGKSFNQAY
ncbi:MAPEG family protein [Sporobolomyces salmoneus]|uniref:MAPEG family protein n=1 Tax=Sporobolomyces salmoneus TaxID=183962 RepID=UPI003178DFE2